MAVDVVWRKEEEDTPESEMKIRTGGKSARNMRAGSESRDKLQPPIPVSFFA